MRDIVKPEVKQIVSNASYFEIKKQNQKGKEIKYKLMHYLSPSMNQDGFAEFYEKAKKAGNPLPPSSIQIRNILEDVINSENNELKNYIYNSLTDNWLNTLTRVVYNIRKKDEVIHFYETSDVYSLKGNIIGQDGWIADVNNQNALELLVGTKDISKLNKISGRINNTEMFLWRLDSKVSEKVEASVIFNSGEDMFNLDAYGDLSENYPTFLIEKFG